MKATEEMKRWFGHGEVDVDLMLRLGVLTDAKLIEYCNVLTDSPWFGQLTPPPKGE